MARPRNKIPQFVSLDIEQLSLIQAQYESDEEFGAWFRKAIMDMRTDCVGKNVDPFIKSQYEMAKSRMHSRQAINATFYESSAKSKSEKTASEDSTEGNLVDEAHNAGSTNNTPAKVAKSPKSSEAKLSFGENKLVLLTMTEGEKLREKYGNDLELAIQILDDYIVNNKRKASKYKSHFCVMKESGWVWNEVQQKKRLAAQVRNAENQGKSYQQQERERTGTAYENLLLLQGAV